jgi:hypothetical protein
MCFYCPSKTEVKTTTNPAPPGHTTAIPPEDTFTTWFTTRSVKSDK